MKVILAVAYDGKAPDATVDLPDDIAAELVYTGRARPQGTAKASASTPAPQATDNK